MQPPLFVKVMLSLLAMIATAWPIRPALAQSAGDPLAKAQTEIQLATNLARTADETWCAKPDAGQAGSQCQQRVHAMTLALRRALYAVQAALPVEPTPTGPVATVQEHVFAEFQKIPPNYDRGSMLVPAHGTGAIPGTAAPDVLGAFRLICAPSHLSYDDPVIYPGQPGKSHLHLFFGNTKADANSTYESLRSSGDPSTCGLLNRSAYWMPALVNGDKVILPGYASVYYKRRPTSDPLCHTSNVECIGLPRGLRYVFGRAMTGGIPSTNKTDPVNFVCTNPSLSSRDFSEILAKCQDGAQVGVQIAANNCWDGTNLDSADHRSHMAQMYWNNAGQQVCPDGHKFQSPDFHFNVFWTMREEMRGAKFSSDIQMNKAAGETVHADWFGAWDDDTLAAWLTNCVDGFKNASGGDLCDGTQIRGASVPSYGFKNPNAVVPVPAPGTTEIVG